MHDETGSGERERAHVANNGDEMIEFNKTASSITVKNVLALETDAKICWGRFRLQISQFKREETRR